MYSDIALQRPGGEWRVLMCVCARNIYMHI